MKGMVFWIVTPCNLQKPDVSEEHVTSCSGSTSKPSKKPAETNGKPNWLLSWLTFRPWLWRWYVTPKSRALRTTWRNNQGDLNLHTVYLHTFRLVNFKSDISESDIYMLNLCMVKRSFTNVKIMTKIKQHLQTIVFLNKICLQQMQIHACLTGST
jgi:hypothetical protein